MQKLHYFSTVRPMAVDAGREVGHHLRRGGMTLLFSVERCTMYFYIRPRALSTDDRKKFKRRGHAHYVRRTELISAFLSIPL